MKVYRHTDGAEYDVPAEDGMAYAYSHVTPEELSEWCKVWEGQTEQFEDEFFFQNDFCLVEVDELYTPENKCWDIDSFKTVYTKRSDGSYKVLWTKE